VILLKIERVSENQIRCTLNKADLADKQLKLSELAYGSPKAKELFREMMQQASNELGFEVDDIPLMIEAVPVSPDCLVLIVTKVEDPEELDTRFSRFSKTSEYDIDDDIDEDDYYEDDNSGISISGHISSSNGDANIPQAVLDAIHGLFDSITKAAESAAGTDSQHNNEGNEQENKPLIFRVVTFDTLPTVIKAAKNVASFYFSTNTLYKNPADNKYYLLVTDDQNTESEFSRTCCILNEYGSLIKTSYAMPYHFMEHYKAIIEDDAIQTLCAL
jgi:adapter protein MecA 1/2